MMTNVEKLLNDKLDEPDYLALKEIADKYHCDGAFRFSTDPIGLSYTLFWIGMIAGSASAALDMQGYDVCEKAQCVISEELRGMVQSLYSI